MTGPARKHHLIDGTLFRFKNGPVLNSDIRYLESDPPANEAEPVGKILVVTSPLSGTLVVMITLDEGKIPEGSERVTTREYHKSTFGYGGLGKYVDDASRPLQTSRPCWVDLRGHWVFAENADPASRDAWSFNFTELETTPAPQDMTCVNYPSEDAMLADHTLLYRDTETGATLRCVTKNIAPREDPDYQPEDHRCVLRTEDGEALLWFTVRDMGARQIIAVAGTPPDDPTLWRGRHEDKRIIGLRLD